MPRPGLLKQEIIRIYWDIKNSGKPVFTRDIAERVTLSKMEGEALKSQIAEYLKAENSYILQRFIFCCKHVPAILKLILHTAMAI